MNWAGFLNADSDVMVFGWTVILFFDTLLVEELYNTLQLYFLLLSLSELCFRKLDRFCKDSNDFYFCSFWSVNPVSILGLGIVSKFGL